MFIEILTHLCNSEISECFVSPTAQDEASFSRLQNPLPYLIMSHTSPMHTFITDLFTIPCNHLIHSLCWKILNPHLKFQIL